MAYTYDIQNHKSDKTSTPCLFICHALRGVLGTFVSTFFVAYIYTTLCDTASFTVFDYIFNCGVYYFSLYLAYTLLYHVFSRIIDYTNRIWAYRIAITLQVSLVIVLVFFGQDLASKIGFVSMVGGLYGMTNALYFASYQIIRQEMVSKRLMAKFSLILTSMQKIVDVVAPITLGFLIDIIAYSKIAIGIAVIGIIIVTISFWIKAQTPNNSHYSIKEFIAKLKRDTPEMKKIRFSYKTCFFYCFTDFGANLAYLCVMLTFGSTASLGGIISLTGLLSAIEILLILKFTKAGKRSWLFITSGSLATLATISFALFPSNATAIIMTVCLGMSYVIVASMFDVMSYGNLKEGGCYDYIAEHHTIIETGLGIAGMISTSLVILIAISQTKVLLSILTILMSLMYLGTLICALIYEKKFKQAEPTPEVVEIEKEPVDKDK